MVDGLLHILQLLVQLNDCLWVFLFLIKHLVPELAQLFLVDSHQCNDLGVLVLLLDYLVYLANEVSNFLFLALRLYLLLADLVE